MGISTQANPNAAIRTATLVFPSTVTNSPFNPDKGPFITRTFSPGIKEGSLSEMALSNNRA